MTDAQKMEVKGVLTFFCEYQLPHTKYEDNSMEFLHLFQSKGTSSIFKINYFLGSDIHF